MTPKEMDGIIRRLDVIDPDWRNENKWNTKFITSETAATYKELIAYEKTLR